MRYIKLFENFDYHNNDFPDIFGKSLKRGVLFVDETNYIDDPKLRKVSTGDSSRSVYVEFLKNFKNVGLQDPTKSVHFFLNLPKEREDLIRRFGTPYWVTPEKDAKFSFNIELRNGGLGSHFFKADRTIEELVNKEDPDFNPDWTSEFFEYQYVPENDKEIVSAYQRFLIKNRVVGNLTYEELLKLAQKGSNPLHIWTENRVFIGEEANEPRPPRDPRPYKSDKLLDREDFLSIGLNPSDIGKFYSSDNGRIVKQLQNDLVNMPDNFHSLREESLELLKKWTDNN
jgi:hypothetical protein